MVSCRFSLHHSIDSCIIYVFLACEVSRRTLVLDYFDSTLAYLGDESSHGSFWWAEFVQTGRLQTKHRCFNACKIGVDDDDDDPLDGRCMVCSIFGRPERKPPSSTTGVFIPHGRQV